MGYRSNVYLKTTTEGWLVMKQFNDSIDDLDEKPLAYGEVNKTESGFYKIYFEDVKWYDSFKQVQNFNEVLAKLEALDIPFSFVRFGEETDDIEHRKNWTDDMPTEIETFEPVADLNDEDWSGYTPVDIAAG